MDIRPPRPTQRPAKLVPPPIDLPAIAEELKPSVKSPRNRVKLIIVAVITLLVLIVLGTLSWYYWAIQPRTNASAAVATRIVVNKGDSANVIAHRLESSKLIRSAQAMILYTELTHTKSGLQAGGYRLSSDQSVAEIVNHLTSGKTDEFTVTILPGATLKDISELLIKDGYSQADIDGALAAHYDQALLADKPATATLEGYLYPDSYKVNAEDSLEVLFNSVFSHFYAKLQSQNLLPAFAAHDLSIYQALTLASIVQKETGVVTDQAQVAQVFYLRLNQGLPLGSDVTFIYAAKQLGVTASPSLDSPYNTRIYAGLPPGPIGNMGDGPLMAVAFPAAGDYVYFVAGDDGKTYFAHTLDEHNANIAAHCKQLCSQ